MYFKIFSKSISFNELEVVSLGRMLVLLIHLGEYVLLSDFPAAVHICNTHAFPFSHFFKNKSYLPLLQSIEKINFMGGQQEHHLHSFKKTKLSQALGFSNKIHVGPEAANVCSVQR